MAEIARFDFDRSRGIVWVCDLVGSSKYLNSDNSADDLEAFLPRLHWTSSIAVEAAGGKFIKWTGDGFLAWFETPLHRELGALAAAALEALWHLTLMVNVTQLGLQPERKFRMRHGVTYEQDALITKITHLDGYESLDITGRAVVLAFRLSSIPAPFPSVISQREVVSAYKENGTPIIHFRKWSPDAEERLRYFKNERWGTGSLFSSGERTARRKSLLAILKQSRQAIALAQGSRKPQRPDSGFANQFLRRFLSGPQWCRDVETQYVEFIRDGLMGSLQGLIEVLETKEASHVEDHSA